MNQIQNCTECPVSTLKQEKQRKKKIYKNYRRRTKMVFLGDMFIFIEIPKFCTKIC